MIVLLYNIDNSWINKHLRFILAKKFNLKESQVTKDFLSSLDELDLCEQEIHELNGLQFATNLTNLKLNKNNIKNCNYLRQLTKLKILEINESYAGVLPFSEKASPEVIKRETGLSKNAFKRAVGHLYKQRIVDITDGKIRLVK